MNDLLTQCKLYAAEAGLLASPVKEVPVTSVDGLCAAQETHRARKTSQRGSFALGDSVTSAPLVVPFLIDPDPKALPHLAAKASHVRSHNRGLCNALRITSKSGIWSKWKGLRASLFHNLTCYRLLPDRNRMLVSFYCCCVTRESSTRRE